MKNEVSVKHAGCEGCSVDSADQRLLVSAPDRSSISSGAIAQLGERMTGSHEVKGSIPFGSTNHFFLPY